MFKRVGEGFDEQFRESLAHAADAVGRDPKILDFAEELIPLDNEALALAEGSTPEGSRNPDIQSPSWHEDVLRERDQQLATGEASFMDWEQAKAYIRSRAHED